MNIKQPDEREVLTVEEVMKVLGIGRRAAYAGVRSGQIPSIRVGRRFLVPVTFVERMLVGEQSSAELSEDQTASDIGDIGNTPEDGRCYRHSAP